MKKRLIILLHCLFISLTSFSQENYENDYSLKNSGFSIIQFVEDSVNFTDTGQIYFDMLMPQLKKTLDSNITMSIFLNSRTFKSEIEKDSLLYYKRANKIIEIMTSKYKFNPLRIFIRNYQSGFIVYPDSKINNLPTGITFDFSG